MPVRPRLPGFHPDITMDIDFLLDALQAAYVSGSLDGETIGALAERSGMRSGEMLCALLDGAPGSRRWLPATAARWGPPGEVFDALRRTAFGTGPTPGRRAALVSLMAIRPNQARTDALTLMADAEAPGDLRAAAAEVLGRCDDERSLAELRRLLVEGAPGTRRLAAWVLGARGARIDLEGLDNATVLGPEEAAVGVTPARHTAAPGREPGR